MDSCHCVTLRCYSLKSKGLSKSEDVKAMDTIDIRAMDTPLNKQELDITVIYGVLECQISDFIKRGRRMPQT